MEGTADHEKNQRPDDRRPMQAPIPKKHKRCAQHAQILSCAANTAMRSFTPCETYTNDTQTTHAHLQPTNSESDWLTVQNSFGTTIGTDPRERGEIACAESRPTNGQERTASRYWVLCDAAKSRMRNKKIQRFDEGAPKLKHLNGTLLAHINVCRVRHLSLCPGCVA